MHRYGSGNAATATALVLLLILGTLAGITTISSRASSAVPGDAGFAGVLTQHNDLSRTGANLNETILTTANVNVNSFGRLFTRPVDGQIYAQPLYVPDLSIPNEGRHNVVFVATMHNTVYAFDADDPAQSTPLWSVNLGPSIPLPDNCIGPGSGYQDMYVEVGIVSTPVIDPATNTMYVVTTTREGSNSGSSCTSSLYHHHLYALDLLTGATKLGGAVDIVASSTGSGSDATNGVITLNQRKELQRPALALANGLVYIGFGSYGDVGPYHGWLLSYRPDFTHNTLQQVGVFNVTPNVVTDSNFTTAYQGGIWQAGQGPAVDADGNLYLNIGNGDVNQVNLNPAGPDFGDSVLEVNPSLTPVSDFIPYDVDNLNHYDLDLGSSGAALLPGTRDVVAGGKQGILYVMTEGSLGGFNSDSNATTDNVLQEFQAGSSLLFGAPVFWNVPNCTATGGTSCRTLYIWATSDHLKAYQYSVNTSGDASVVTTPASMSPNSAPIPGGILSLSANGTTPGTGIIWAARPLSNNADHNTVAGLLEAFDASNLSQPLWTSQLNAARDAVGNFAKFTPPTIANGKVYLATFSDQLDVYGLLPSSPTSGSATVTATTSPTPSATGTGTPTATPTPTSTPTATATGTATPSASASPTSSVTPTTTATATGNSGPANGLVGYWPLDEGSGKTTVDLSGNGNNGQLFGGTTWVTGEFGSALQFDGRSGYVSAGVNNLPLASAAQSIAFWFRNSVQRSGARCVLTLGAVRANASIQICVQANLIGVMQPGGGYLAVAPLPSDQAWHHYAYTSTGTQCALYRDGTLVSTSKRAAGAGAQALLYFGRGMSSNSYVSGAVDDIRIYNRALSGSEIALLAQPSQAIGKGSPR